MLFVIGGNGSHAGANAIHEEVVTLFSFHIFRSFKHVVIKFI
jgi:6-phosphofructokinase